MSKLVLSAALPIALGASLLLSASSAAALSFSMAPVGFGHSSGANGTISLVGGSEGLGLPAGGLQLFGTTGVSDDVLIFQVTLTSGSVDEIGVGVFPPSTPSTGSGTVPGGGVDVADGSGSTLPTPAFSFDAGGNGVLDAGETSDAFFVSYGSLASGSSVNFSVIVGAVGETFSGTVITVPEASTLALLGLGLVGLCRVRGRRD